MSKLQKNLAIAGVVLSVVLIGIVLGWWGSRGGNLPPVPDSSSPALAHTPPRLATEPGRPQTTPKPVEGEPSLTAFNEKHPKRPQPQNQNPVAAASALITNWEDKVDEILTAEGEDEPEKAKKMLEMFPRLPPEGQVEVAQHLSNLVADENYAALARFLTDSKLPEDVLDVLMADVLNRPNSLKLPALLEVAKDTQNPKATEAKDILELFLEEDYGTDWNKWQAKMGEWLKANPD